MKPWDGWQDRCRLIGPHRKIEHTARQPWQHKANIEKRHHSTSCDYALQKCTTISCNSAAGTTPMLMRWRWEGPINEHCPRAPRQHTIKNTLPKSCHAVKKNNRVDHKCVRTGGGCVCKELQQAASKNKTCTSDIEMWPEDSASTMPCSKRHI